MSFRPGAAPFDLHVIVTARAYADARPFDIFVTLGYGRHDPYAIHLRIVDPSFPDHPVDWVVSREAIDRAVCGRLPDAGAIKADFVIFPARGGSYSVWLQPPSEQRACFWLPEHEVRHFLRDTYDLVPQGAEPSHLHLDQELAEFLAGN